MKHSYKSSALWLIIPVALIFLVLLPLSFYLEPFRGDLSRIAGLPANKYGWTSYQQRFEPPLFDKIPSPKQVKKPYDIVVLGDSFSQDLEHGWINYVVADTGFSAVRFDIRTVRPDDIINSAWYQQSPPKLFIYQTVERRLHLRGPALKTACINDRALKAKKISYPFKSLQPNIVERTIPEPQPFSFDVPTQFLKQQIKGSYKKQRVLLGELNTDQLFSSKKSNVLLYYREDLEKFKASAETHAESRCGLKDLQHKIQQNGKTNFLVLIAPDKSNIYADYLNTERSLRHNIDDILAPPLQTINLHQLLRVQVEAGVIDVYLPDDTHWGMAGYKLVGEKVVEFLK